MEKQPSTSFSLPTHPLKNHVSETFKYFTCHLFTEARPVNVTVQRGEYERAKEILELDSSHENSVSHEKQIKAVIKT